MQSTSQGYANPYVVAAAPENVRAEFIRLTYTHLAGAIALFVVVEMILLRQPWAASFSNVMIGNWWVVLLAFIGVSWIADHWAQTSTTKSAQYGALGLFVIAEAIIFLPLLYVASTFYEGVITNAALLTGALFLGLTVVAFTTKKDFSFLGGFLKIAFIVALGLIFLNFIPGLPINLGTWFSAAMILLAAGSVLYTTSNVIHHYRPDQYVGASLALFSGIALMFWYILQIFMSRR
ncbi:MAG: Bax inhibitor-1/YccA family protein [Verrucomicrobiales bacterium]